MNIKFLREFIELRPQYVLDNYPNQFQKTAGKELEEMYSLLKEAYEHLEWCGYGDSYERECARDKKLPERLAAAITD